MPDLVSRLEFRTAVRQRTDTVGSTFVSDTEINSWIDLAVRELYDRLVMALGEEYYTTLQTVTTTTTLTNGLAYAGSWTSWPSNIYKIKGIYLVSGTTRIPLERKSLEDIIMDDPSRRSASWSSTRVPSCIWYTLTPNNLIVSPAPPAGITVLLAYIPVFSGFADDNATFDTIHGWDDYVVADVSAKVRVKEDLDPSPFLAEKAAAAQRIEVMKINRDQGQTWVVREESY